MDRSTLSDLFTAWWDSGDRDAARVLADALLESGELKEQFVDLPAEQLAGMLQTFRSAALVAPVLAAAFGRVSEALGTALQEAVQGFRAFAEAMGQLPRHDQPTR